jgi:hypothetical protein
MNIIYWVRKMKEAIRKLIKTILGKRQNKGTKADEIWNKLFRIF